MRLDPDHNEPAAPLWPFVTILQLAFVKAMKDSTGGTLYRGGLVSKAELDEVRKSLAAGSDGEILLRCVTSCSRSEKVAAGFASSAKESETMVRVMDPVSMKQVHYTAAMGRQPGLPYGPAVPVELVSDYPGEKEVILLDGTVLKVSPGGLKEGSRKAFTEEVGTYDFEGVQIKARVDWDELGAYFALCDEARPGPQ
jgi:hypothetical protein